MSAVQGFATVLGRVMLGTIFLLSAVGNKIPNFTAVASYMTSEGVPASQVLLAGAIVFLIAGSLSVMTGFQARYGAAMLLIFLVLATYFFHDFWKFTGKEQELQMIQFMKNLSMMGTMVFLMANGSGPWSLDSLIFRKLRSPQKI
ncbi:DoxX family protein [Planctomicrobium piriforme]|uniref:Putative oxidoreductase n=1 Tax=Planctomicrobium piriforme TaxID=1576369 RepID=A0A1I3RUC6_9PLAN|nr:DoxX family protein [Planctomicrobium piriforme]SFJ48816.1 putative oxidoreductase [Planctomicrobium piriforme]